MKYFIALVLFFSFSLISYSSAVAQSGANFVDANNLKQGHWTITIKQKKLPNYKEGQTIEEGFYKDGRKEGVWTKFYASGQKEHELTFINNKLDGLAVFYYRSGKRKEEGIWRKNRWIGDYKYFFKNGNVRNEWKYSETGKRSGIQRYYYKNGKVKIEGAWENGKESGALTEFYEDGTVKSERFFANGKLDTVRTKSYPKEKLPVEADPLVSVVVDSGVTQEEIKNKPVKPKAPFNGTGYHEFLDKKGRIIKKGSFQNGYLRNGEMYKYSEAGKLSKTFIYKKGKKIREVHH